MNTSNQYTDAEKFRLPLIAFHHAAQSRTIQAACTQTAARIGYTGARKQIVRAA